MTALDDGVSNGMSLNGNVAARPGRVNSDWTGVVLGGCKRKKSWNKWDVLKDNLSHQLPPRSCLAGLGCFDLTNTGAVRTLTKQTLIPDSKLQQEYDSAFKQEAVNHWKSSGKSAIKVAGE